jgi:hypothetical protein
MTARDRRRLYTRAGILMVTKEFDPVRAILEAGQQLGILELVASPQERHLPDRTASPGVGRTPR